MLAFAVTLLIFYPLLSLTVYHVRMGNGLLVPLWPGQLWRVTTGNQGEFFNAILPCVHSNQCKTLPLQSIQFGFLLSRHQMAAVCWLYYFSKFIEMLDTVGRLGPEVFSGRLIASITDSLSLCLFFQVFFVLRKKNSQVTFLHVYHHSIMPFTWWFGVRFAPGRFFFFKIISYFFFFNYVIFKCNVLNSPFEVVWGRSMPSLTAWSMSSCTLTTVWLPWAPTTRSTCGGRSTSPPFSWYAEFLLCFSSTLPLKSLASLLTASCPVSALHPPHPPQIQFVMVTSHISQYFFISDCPYQFPIFIYIIGLYGLIFLCLFLNFWYHAYTKGKRLPKVLQVKTWAHHTNGVMNGNACQEKDEWCRPRLHSAVGECKRLLSEDRLPIWRDCVLLIPSLFEMATGNPLNYNKSCI